MGPYVEANSLSDITQIASNPPRYPRNPTEKQRQPLTLYIARVPGSKDIILTTLKPQLKNVTAEDVASSLYYFHLNTEDDARLLADEQEDAIAENTEPSSVMQKPLPRKPLPDTSGSSLDYNRSGESNLRHLAVQTAPDHLPRKPLPLPARPPLNLDPSERLRNPDPSIQVGLSSSTDREFQRKEVASHDPPTQPHDQAKEAVQRRPLGPRPLASETLIERKPLSGIENQPLNRTSQFDEFTTAKMSSDSARSDLSSYDGLKLDGSRKSFSITVIRRHPSSGAQWNIGAVVGEAHSQGRKAISNPKKPYFDISVHLTTPGYTQFRDSQRNSHHDNLPQLRSQQAAVSESGVAAPEWGFDRQVRMEGSSIWNRSKEHKRSQSDNLDTRAEARGNTAVLPSVTPGDSAADTRDSGSKGYVFLSPWGGRCKFSTGGGGRSLRCKHTLPDSLSSKNAVFESSGSSTVSELRFNLPHSAVFSPSITSKSAKGGAESRRFSIPKFSHIRNKLSQTPRPPLPPRPHPSSYAAMYPSDDEEPPPLPPRYTGQGVADSSDEHEPSPISTRSQVFGHAPRSPSGEEDEKLDLSIGQEKAGGGNRGKRAKLGKLIIHDEGFKMLDLLVAANMGIWWSVWGCDHR